MKSLTIGVISRDGVPFIEWMLDTLLQDIETLLKEFSSVQFVFVDSDSTDGTLEVMKQFAKRCKNVSSLFVKIFALHGHCNASKARNVILKASQGDIVFLCDGDIEINPNFIIDAMGEIVAGKADAVVGQLYEKWYDADFMQYNEAFERTKIKDRNFVRMSGGLIVLSLKIVLSGLRYDESLRRNEDRDFTLRLTETFRFLAIPQSMGTHLTQPYLSDERYLVYLKEKYSRPVGRLLRKNIHKPKNFFEICRTDIGVMLGVGYVMVFPITLICLFWTNIPLLLIVVITALDFSRALIKHTIRKFVIFRIISPFMVIEGFIRGKCDVVSYSVKQVL